MRGPHTTMSQPQWEGKLWYQTEGKTNYKFSTLSAPTGFHSASTSYVHMFMFPPHTVPLGLLRNCLNFFVLLYQNAPVIYCNENFLLRSLRQRHQHIQCWVRGILCFQHSALMLHLHMVKGIKGKRDIKMRGALLLWVINSTN